LGVSRHNARGQGVVSPNSTLLALWERSFGDGMLGLKTLDPLLVGEIICNFHMPWMYIVEDGTSVYGNGNDGSGRNDSGVSVS